MGNTTQRYTMFQNTLFDDFYRQPRVYRRPRYARNYYEPEISGFQTPTIFYDPFYQQYASDLRADPRYFNLKRKAEHNKEKSTVLEPKTTQNLTNPGPATYPVEIKINHIDSEGETSSDEESQPSETSVPASTHSETHKIINEIRVESENIEETLNECANLEDKAATKKLRYAAEMQYKLIEKLDALNIEEPKDKLTRKETIREIQMRLDAADRKLNE